MSLTICAYAAPMQSAQHSYLYTQILRQAELYLTHNVQECRSRRNEGNRWLFRRGMEQGIDCGIYFYFTHSPHPADKPLAQILFDHKKEIMETCELTPHKAVQHWGLTALEDLLDVERVAVISGLNHGLSSVAHNLPRLIRDLQNKKASQGRLQSALVKKN